MKTITVSRRQVLRGVGGFALPLPFLPSLFPRRADGATLALNRQPMFVAITTVHGAVRPESMYPSAGVLTQSAELVPGHTIKYGTLPTSGALSAVLKAASLTPKLVGKMNVLRSGFDMPYYSGHHSGYLGAFHVNDQGPGGLRANASIDQIMAYSPSFYKDTAGVKMRSIVTGKGGFQSGGSFAFSNPATGTGTVSRVGIDGNTGGLFDRLFGGGMSMTPATTPRKPIVDRVLASYTGLMQSNRRLSVDDRQRLSGHVELLRELERSAKTTPTRTCGNTKRPGGDWAGFNDVISMAFACGTSRVATIAVPPGEFHGHGGGYHQGIAHQSGGNQPTIVSVHQQVFEKVFVDLIKKLDEVELAPGRTALDDSMVMWVCEAGAETHMSVDAPVVLAGGAAGFFKTGMFVDLRGTKKMRLFGSFGPPLGIPHRKMLATALHAMGVPPSEWEKYGRPGWGYGDPFQDSGYTTQQLGPVFEKASEPLGVIMA
jgi:hypothetical protein